MGIPTGPICDNIEASRKAVGCPENFQLASATTDTGEAGTLEASANKLIERGAAIKEMIANNCDIHSLNVASGNGVPAFFGNGAMENKNMVQMMSNIYSMQIHLGTYEFQKYAKMAAEWVREQLAENPTPEEGHFQPKFDRIKAWRNDWKLPAKGDDGKSIGVLSLAKKSQIPTVRRGSPFPLLVDGNTWGNQSRSRGILTLSSSECASW